MRKKELIEKKFTSVSKAKEKYALCEGECYIVSSKVIIQEHEKILLLDFFRDQLIMRAVFSKNSYQYYHYEEKKWSKADHYSNLGYYTLIYLSEEDKLRTEKFLNNDAKTLYYKIDRYEEKIKYQRRKKREKLKEEIEQGWCDKIIYPLPRDHKKFLFDRVPHYAMQDETEVYCTHCKKTYIQEKKKKHLSHTKCPYCQADLTVQDIHRGRQFLWDIEWLMVPQPTKDGGIILRYVMYSRIIRNMDIDQTETDLEEQARIYIKNGKSVHFQEKYGKKWKESARKYFQSTRMGYQSNSAYCGASYFYNKKMGEIFQSVNHLKYWKNDMMKEFTGKREWWLLMLELSNPEERKIPVYEKMIKCDMPQLAIHFCMGTYSCLYGYATSKSKNLLDFSQEDLCSILKLNRTELKWLQEEPSMSKLELLQKHVFTKKKDMLFWYSYMGKDTSKLTPRNLYDYTPLKILKYLIRQWNHMIPNDQSERENYMNYKWNEWINYMDTVEKLELPTKNEIISFPKDFQAADKRITEMWNKKRKKEEEERDQVYKDTMEHIANELQQNDNTKLSKFFNGMLGLKVIIPTSADMLVKEGARMGNCLSRYVDKVADKKTAIFFIRKCSDPEKEYYAMEYSDGKVLQLEAKAHSRDTKGNVEAFAKMFAKTLDELHWDEPEFVQQKENIGVA